MKIGINLLFLKPSLSGGTETYSKSLLQAFADLQSQDLIFYIFCSSELDTNFLTPYSNFIIVKFNRVSRSLGYRLFFEQFIFPFKITKYKIDVLHSLGYTGPFFIKNHFVTIHDTNSFSHKDAMPLSKRLILSSFLVTVAKKCRHIITVSNFSKQEIIKNLKAPAEKISVVYEACKFDKSVIAGIPPLPSKYQHIAGNRYFIALTSVSPHKNIPVLVTAFKKLQLVNSDITLVLAGHIPYNNSIQHFITAEDLDKKIIVTGFVEDEVLAALLKNAFCFVFPSLYEGFGLPLLEAQSAGLPVIASNKASLPEVGGDSALYFRAEDPNDLFAKMNEIVSDEHTRQKFITLGYENVKRFSWEKAAKETIKLYETKRSN